MSHFEKLVLLLDEFKNNEADAFSVACSIEGLIAQLIYEGLEAYENIHR